VSVERLEGIVDSHLFEDLLIDGVRNYRYPLNSCLQQVNHDKSVPFSRSRFSSVASKQNVSVVYWGATPIAYINIRFINRANAQDEKDKLEP
jgi:hypothetical protein